MLGRADSTPRGRADGFIDRFLLAYPDPLPVADWSDRGIPDDVSRRLVFLDRPAVDRDRSNLQERPQSVPHVAYFTPEGKADGRNATTPIPRR